MKIFLFIIFYYSSIEKSLGLLGNDFKKFKLENDYQQSKDLDINLKFTNTSSNLLNKRSLFLSNTTLETKSVYNFFLNTASTSTFLIHKKCINCEKWAKQVYYSDPKDAVKESLIFSFGTVGGFNTNETITFGESVDSKINLPILMITESEFMNTQIKFDGALGLGWTNITSKESLLNKGNGFLNSLKNENVFFLAIDYYKKLFYLGGLEESLMNKTTSCRQVLTELPLNKQQWGCYLKYILIGEEYDFYLAKEINSPIYFDSLGYFSIIPYTYLDLFLKNYFPKSTNCTVLEIQKLFRVVCNSNFGIEQFQTINIILNGWAYKLKNTDLLDKSDIMTNEKIFEKDMYYFNILFSKNITVWTMGSSFFNRHLIGYNYLEYRVYIYNEDKFDFTRYTQDDKIDNNLVFIITLFVVGGVLVILIGILIRVYYKQRNVIAEEYRKTIRNSEVTPELNEIFIQNDKEEEVIN